MKKIVSKISIIDTFCDRPMISLASAAESLVNPLNLRNYGPIVIGMKDTATFNGTSVPLIFFARIPLLQHAQAPCVFKVLHGHSTVNSTGNPWRL
jgi:hypothetical protein